MIRGDPDRIAAVVAFLKTLTVDRLGIQAVPFDHPQLKVPKDHKTDGSLNLATIPEVGVGGGPPLYTFEEILNQGRFSNATATGGSLESRSL